jgi:hypothetical protein
LSETAPLFSDFAHIYIDFSPVNGMDVPYPMPFSSKSDRKVKEVKKTVDPDMLELSQAFAVMSELMASKKPTDTLTEEEEAQLREKVEVVRSQLAAMGFELQLGGEVTDFHGPEGSVPTFALKKMEDGTDDDDRSEPKTTAKRKSASKS